MCAEDALQATDSFGSIVVFGEFVLEGVAVPIGGVSEPFSLLTSELSAELLISVACSLLDWVISIKLEESVGTLSGVNGLLELQLLRMKVDASANLKRDCG